MKILFVANLFSTHTARWISQLAQTNWDIHVFDPLHHLIHPDLAGVTVHTAWKKASVPKGTTVKARWPLLRGRNMFQSIFPRVWQKIVPEESIMLSQLIRQLEPDIIHGLGLQNYTETLFQALKASINLINGTPWIYSSWGSDLFYWGQINSHKGQIRKIVSACPYYIGECQRDIQLVREFGFKGEILGFFQGGGGFPISKMQTGHHCSFPSKRRIITVKGLQGLMGRAFTACDALRRCKELLTDYTIVFHQAHPDVYFEAERLESFLEIPVKIMPRCHYSKIWELLGTSRTNIGINLSDGVPNTMIEAMIMGSLPIQTDAGGATSEWIENRVNGLIVPHDSSNQIADAIRMALTDDDLINSAAEHNIAMCKQRIDATVVQPKVINLYEYVAQKMIKGNI